MTLQEQVCTIEQARVLKELGCEQGKSVFAWSWIRDNVNNRERFFLAMQPDEFFPAICDAYTGAELEIMLLEFSGSGVLYEADEAHKEVEYAYLPVGAKAKAALLIHILEQEEEQ